MLLNPVRHVPAPDIASARAGVDNDAFPLNITLTMLKGVFAERPSEQRRTRWLPVLLLPALALGCATTPPPTGELATAQQALARALEADAEQYADDALTRARHLLEQAQAALNEGQHRQARDLATLALASADLARARSQNTQTLSELEQQRHQLAELRRTLQREELP